MADKYLVREYVKEKIGEEYLVSLLGVYNNVEEIDFDTLPNQFVLKCNHDSEVVICRDKSNSDYRCKKGKLNSTEQVKNYLAKRLKLNFYKASREWPYKNIPRKIVCEEYLSDGVKESLTDYKFFCFNGEPKVMHIVSEYNGSRYFDYFDMNYDHLPISQFDHANLPNKTSFSKPENFEEMKLVASKLAQKFPHVRIDLYNISGRVYFSEITFFTAGGFVPFNPEKWDVTLGEYIELPQKKHRAR